MQRQHVAEESNTQRLEAFSDGVFAIAITLLVLDMHVPDALGAGKVSGVSSLGKALLGLWPTYFAYVFSFVMIGIFWVCHHYVFKLYKRTGHIFLLLNVLISYVYFRLAVSHIHSREVFQG